MKRVLDTYGDRVRFVYRNFPLDSHPEARPAAEAAQCANEQGQFWAYHDWLFSEPGKLSDADLKHAAAALGMDSPRFNKCVDGHKYLSVVDADAKAGSDAGVTGTPAFFINGRLLSRSVTTRSNMSSTKSSNSRNADYLSRSRGRPLRAAAAQEARARQEAIEKLVIPDHTIGETEGVSMNSKGHLFVYSRTGKGGSARGGTAAELFEFDQSNKFVKMWAPDSYGASFAHSVRVDKYDNVWFVDEGSSMVVKMDPNGVVKMTLGRKPEAVDWFERFVERGEKDTDRYPNGSMGTFNRPTDVAWDAQDNIYVSDGYGNSRFVKIAKDGTCVKAVGTHGSGPNQFSTPHGIASDGQNVYVADRGNSRIQVYDTNMDFKASYTGVGAPWSVQVTPKYIYSGDGTGKIYRLDHSGKLLGWVQTSLGQTGCLIHELYAVSSSRARAPNATWRRSRSRAAASLKRAAAESLEVRSQKSEVPSSFRLLTSQRTTTIVISWSATRAPSSARQRST